MLLVFNGWHDGVEFMLPPAAEGGNWTRLFDTALEVQAADTFAASHPYVITGRSVVALACDGSASAAQALAGLLGSLP